MIVEKMYNGVNKEFNCYKLTLENGVNKYVPLDRENSDYENIQTWIDNGGDVIDNPPDEPEAE